MKTKTLSRSQAKAVYSAVLALKKVGASFDRVEFGDFVKLCNHHKAESFEVSVRGVATEQYKNQAEFAAFYDL